MYISPDCFFDVDFPIVRGLNKKYNLTWIQFFSDETRFSYEDIHRFCVKYGIKYKVIKKIFRYRNPLSLLSYYRLICIIKKKNPDVIYFEFQGAPYLHLLTKIFLEINKVVIAIHDVEQHRGIDNKTIKQKYLNFTLTNFKHYHFFSKTQESIFQKKYGTIKKSIVAELCLKDFGKPSDEKKTGKGKIKFLFLGTIAYRKGLDILIKAFNELDKYKDKIEVTIAGKCDEWEKYDQLIDDKSIYSLKIDFVKNEDIPNTYANTDYMILPYRDVTQSGPLLIAYNYNVPVIASDFPGFREYIENDKTGYLFKPESVQALSNLLVKIINTHEHTYDKMSDDLKKFITENISNEAIISKYINLFNSI